MVNPSDPEIADLARRLEQAEAEDVAAAVRAGLERGEEHRAVYEIGSARLIDAGPDSHLDRVYGFGFDPVADPTVLDRIEAIFAAQGRTPRIELSPYAHPGYLPLLGARRYGVEAFRDVLVRPLDGGLPVISTPGVTVREIDRSDEAEVRSTVHLVGRGFAEGAEPPGSAIAVGMIYLRGPGARTFVASVDGVPAGAGSLVYRDGRIVMLGASTLPEHRRRGVQAALMVARLAAGRAHGASLATVHASPGAATRRNAERLGFRLAYTRVTVARP